MPNGTVTMAVREFSDSKGREWRVWDVVPETIHPQTKSEDYLAAMYQTGWLVFETKAEDEKRRLADVPANWSELSDQALEVLLHRAEVIPPRKPRSAQHLADLPPAALSKLPPEQRPDVTDLGVVRTFRYPGGRYWTVCVIRHPEEGGPPVLRFTAGARDIDLRDWPKDWADYPDERLVDLLRLAAPRPPGQPLGPDTPRRRHDDPPRDV